MTEPTSPLPAASPAPRQRASPTPPPRGRGHSRGRHPTLHLPAWGLVCRQHGLSGERVLIGMLSDGFSLGFRKDTDICLKANCLASFLSLSLQGVGGQGCSASCLVLHSREGSPSSLQTSLPPSGPRPCGAGCSRGQGAPARIWGQAGSGQPSLQPQTHHMLCRVKGHPSARHGLWEPHSPGAHG